MEVGRRSVRVKLRTDLASDPQLKPWEASRWGPYVGIPAFGVVKPEGEALGGQPPGVGTDRPSKRPTVKALGAAEGRIQGFLHVERGRERGKALGGQPPGAGTGDRPSKRPTQR